jgi:hypothetical protein
MATHSSFKSFGAAIEKEMKASVESEVKARARKGQALLDRVLATYGGQPVETIVPHMRTALKQASLFEDEAQVRRYSQTVADGDRIVFEVQPIRW